MRTSLTGLPTQPEDRYSARPDAGPGCAHCSVYYSDGCVGPIRLVKSFSLSPGFTARSLASNTQGLLTCNEATHEICPVHFPLVSLGKWRVSATTRGLMPRPMAGRTAVRTVRRLGCKRDQMQGGNFCIIRDRLAFYSSVSFRGMPPEFPVPPDRVLRTGLFMAIVFCVDRSQATVSNAFVLLAARDSSPSSN